MLGKIIGIYTALLILYRVINLFEVHTLYFLNTISIILYFVGIACFAFAVLAKAPIYQSAKYVFAKFYNDTGLYNFLR